jgi:hypothetical protein
VNTMHVAFRNLLIYLICIPLALFLGYQLTNPLSYEAVATVGIVLGVLLVPVLLKWHRPVLFFSIGAAMVVFFLPGRPKLGLVMVAVSLGVSILQRAIQPNFRFIRVPEMTWPLFAVMGVVLLTMLLRGGLGLSFFGSRTAGGSRYLMLMLGLLSFFALTAQPIPRDRLKTYVGLFFLSGITAMIGDFFALVTPALHPVFLFFPPSVHSMRGEFDIGVTRLFGITLMAAAVFRYLLARHGLTGIFSSSHRLRLLFFIGIAGASMIGGSRLTLIAAMLLVFFMFYLEGLHRTRLIVPVLTVGVLVMTMTLVFLPRMPFQVQRSLSFLPVPIDPAARLSAQHSSDWRVEMWRSVLPEVPGHLLLGKGLGVSEADLEAATNVTLASRTPDQWLWSAIMGDFHNGPLSVVLTFGIWGLIAFVWLQLAGWRVLYLNYRNGSAELRTLNTFLLASYSVQLIVFWFVFGSMYAETIIFMSMVGFGVAANGGVCRQPVPARQLVEPSGVEAVKPATKPARPRGRPPGLVTPPSFGHAPR